MKNILSIITISILLSCGVKPMSTTENNVLAKKIIPESPAPKQMESDKIKVLNFATFHMAETVDANKVDFDETDLKNQKDANKLAAMLSKFKPTIICVEVPLEEQEEINIRFQKYLNSDKPSSYKGEVGLVAFEVGKMSNVDKIYGIDCEMGYNYNIANEIENKIDLQTMQEFYSNPIKYFPSLNVDQSKLTFFDRMKIGNTPEFLDFLILTNADMLTYVGSKNGYEGADEAAKYYKRNLRIFSNLNRIPTTKEDRIFIL